MAFVQSSESENKTNRAAEERRILEFIGVEHAGALTSPFTKLAVKSVKAMIQNYDEVALELRGTEFEWCLED